MSSTPVTSPHAGAHAVGRVVEPVTRSTAPPPTATWPPRFVPAARRTLVEQAVRFSLVGGICTVVYSALFLTLAEYLGGTLANTIAMVVGAVLNTALNRRHTFGAAGSGALRHHAQGLVIFVLTWLLAIGALAAQRVVAPDATHADELVLLTVANLGGTLMRFVLLRAWVFRPQQDHTGPRA